LNADEGGPGGAQEHQHKEKEFHLLGSKAREPPSEKRCCGKNLLDVTKLHRAGTGGTDRRRRVIFPPALTTPAILRRYSVVTLANFGGIGSPGQIA